MPFLEFPPLPAHPGLDIAAFTEPFLGETVNGDGLFVEAGRADGCLMLLMVDVTHHGSATVPTMDTIRDTLADRRAWGLQPAELLRELHQALANEWDRTGNFACALAVKADTSAGVLAAKAATPAPWVRLGAGWREWVWPGSPPLGLPIFDMGFVDVADAFPAGASLLAFTDGVTEAGAKGGAGQFQHGGLAAFLAGAAGGPNAAVAGLIAAVRAHVGPSWPDDDTTTFCIRRA
jgi:hypothetical protein